MLKKKDKEYHTGVCKLFTEKSISMHLDVVLH